MQVDHPPASLSTYLMLSPLSLTVAPGACRTVALPTLQTRQLRHRHVILFIQVLELVDNRTETLPLDFLPLLIKARETVLIVTHGSLSSYGTGGFLRNPH